MGEGAETGPGRGDGAGAPQPWCETAESAWHGGHTVGLGELPPGSATSKVLFVRALFSTFNGEGLLGIEPGFSYCWHYWLARRLLRKIADSKPSCSFFLPPSAKRDCFLGENGRDSL